MKSFRGQTGAAWRGLGALCLWACCTGEACALAEATDGTGPSVITRVDEAWWPDEEGRKSEYPIRIEARINFADPMWGNLWLEQREGTGFLFLGNPAPALKTGQRVVIEGTLVPAEGLRADKVRVTVLADFDPVVPLAATGRLEEIAAFDRRIVVVEGYVDETLLVDRGHLRLGMIAGDRPVICWVPPDDPDHVPNFNGKFVRVTALYSGRLDPSGTNGSVELWVARQNDVEVVGSIASDPRFVGPVTSIRRISSLASTEAILVRGILFRREPGKVMVIRDADGEIEALTWQRERIPVGSTVEALGRPGFDGSRWVLQDSLVRQAANDTLSSPLQEGPGALRYVEDIRNQSATARAGGIAVDIQGVVTWTDPVARVFYLHDTTGGVKVLFAEGVMRPPVLQKGLRVIGVTGDEHGTPTVHVQRIVDLGSMAHPEAPLVEFDRAMVGAEDGQWVAMRGFVHKIESGSGLCRLHVTTPRGEFVAHLQTGGANIVELGALVRIQGVCESEFDESGQRTGVRLLVPFLQGVGVEEDAPADPFALPQYSMEDLTRMSVAGDLHRVHVRGTVVHHVSGDYLVLEHEGHGLRVVASDSVPADLKPGDVLDVVGVLGREGARTVLRQADCRLVGAASPPETILLDVSMGLRPDFDQRLVRTTALLLDSLNQPDGVAYTMQSKGSVFEGLWYRHGSNETAPEVEIGALVELTGLYWVEFDDAGYPREFDVILRSANDVVVLSPPAFWTVPRALLGAGVLAGGAVLALLWGETLRRRVARQTLTIKEQFEKQARLEAEIERGQRLHSLGLLAGGIAHDFNNLLTVILGNITLARMEPHVKELAGDYLEEAETGSKRARDLTQQLITFAKGGEPIVAAVDFVELMHETIALAMSGSSIRVEFRHPLGLPALSADRGQLSRALQNLLIHARRQAMRGGLISVETAVETASEPSRTGLAPGTYLMATIKDYGSGVAPERLAEFFDPYSGEVGSEDRFALAIAYSVIKRHGGRIEVASGDADGTVFYLWLPTTQATPATDAEEVLTLPVDLEGVRVLVMDDDRHICTLAERLLRRMKCDPVTTPDGAACVAAYRKAMAAGHPFDLVILDLTVPGGVGGLAAMEQLLALDPKVKAIVSSGYSSDPVLADFRKFGFVAMVPKPFAVETLAETVRDVVRGGS